MNNFKFNFGGFSQSIPKPAIFWITPITDKALEFRNKFGEVFTVRELDKKQCTMTLETGYNELITVKKDEKGIWVNGELFAEAWYVGTLKQVLVITVGVAGSGKSTVVESMRRGWAHKHFKVICPDEIREKHCGGNRSDQSKNGAVWKEAYDLLDEYIKGGFDVIFDSTMLTPAKRKQLIKIGKDAGMFVIAAVVERDEEVIKKQNANRKWKVPEYVIDNMIKSYVRPTEEEGFDVIQMY